MAVPKVFEVAFKTEVEAPDLDAAISMARERIASTISGVRICHGIIRDDSLYNGRKDIVSRYTEHIVVLSPAERQELESIISDLGRLSSPTADEEATALHNRASSILGWNGG